MRAGVDYVQAFLGYILKTGPRGTMQALDDVADRPAPELRGDLMTSGEELRREGVRRGRRQGRQRGRQEGRHEGRQGGIVGTIRIGGLLSRYSQCPDRRPDRNARRPVSARRQIRIIGR